MMTRRMAIWVSVLGMVIAPITGISQVAEVGKQETEDRTLSPYFAIKNGDPSVDNFPLKRTEVKVSIVGVIAHVTVTQTYENRGERPINAKYIFPASTRAAVHGMKMTIGEHVITARIRERQTAKKEFKAAKKAGKSAALLEQQRPNVFSMNVANVMPGDVIDVELRYSELIVPVAGTYDFVYPTVVGPRYSEITGGTATDHDTWVESPYLHDGEDTPSVFDINVKMSTGIPMKELACRTHKTDVVWEGQDSALVSLADASGAAGNRDFILRYRLAGEQIQSGLMLYQGEDENFFLLLAEPPEKVRLADIPPREYIFVVDVSGSMNGFPLDVSKDLLRSLIGSLRPTDTFNVILFSGTSTAMADRSVPANQENITTAIRVIDDQQGGGGTRLRSALAHAIAMPHEENSSRTIVVATDGYIAAEHDVFTLVRENLDEVNVFAFGIGSSVNRYLIEGIARAGKGEPFVVTDKREARAAARDFQSYISSPVLTGITIDCGSFEAYAVEPMAIPDLMGQRPIQVFGKWRGAAYGTITIRGTTGKGEYEQTFDVAHTPPREENESLRYLWARARLTELSDYCDQPDHPENIKAVIALGLKYELLTRHTSFVAVHEVVRNTGGDSVDVKQPLPLPQGVSDLAVGGPQPSPYAASVAVGSAAMPEPDLAVMLVIMAACAVVAFVCSGLSIRAGESG